MGNAGYAEFLVRVFNERLKEMDQPLCRLAMLLHPNYKGAVMLQHGFDVLVEKVFPQLCKAGPLHQLLCLLSSSY